MFATTLKSASFSISKRAILVGLTIVVLAVAVFAVTPSISLAGDASAPSACGICAGR